MGILSILSHKPTPEQIDPSELQKPPPIMTNASYGLRIVDYWWTVKDGPCISLYDETLMS